MIFFSKRKLDAHFKKNEGSKVKKRKTNFGVIDIRTQNPNLEAEEEEMVVRLRLARLGCRNRPFYRVMAADSRSPRDGKHIEVLGYYNPLPGQDGGKRMGLNFERVK
ncbi:putative ribosomal protein S16 [Helianthus annuus]|nr:putative ribosomal protein S16 [Helianthus annuus]